MYPKNLIFGTLGVILEDINFKKRVSDVDLQDLVL